MVSEVSQGAGEGEVVIGGGRWGVEEEEGKGGVGGGFVGGEADFPDEVEGVFRELRYDLGMEVWVGDAWEGFNCRVVGGEGKDAYRVGVGVRRIEGVNCLIEHVCGGRWVWVVVNPGKLVGEENPRGARVGGEE